MTNGTPGNGSAGSGRTGAQVERESISCGRIYELVRAHFLTLAETERRAQGVEGLDRPEALRNLADEIEADVPMFLQVAALARAEAIGIERDRAAKLRPVPAEETSETRRARQGKDDSSPGRKRS